METTNKTIISLNTTVNAPVRKVWKFWTTPGHITKWCWASDDWHAPYAENDLREGGMFLTRMEARDGSSGFDFWGVYDKVETHKLLEYTIGDGRNVKISFSNMGNTTEVVETFETETEHTTEQQRSGWQSILNNFKEYVESN